VYGLSLGRQQPQRVSRRGCGLPCVARCSPWTAAARRKRQKSTSATSLNGGCDCAMVVTSTGVRRNEAIERASGGSTCDRPSLRPVATH
jgi:hypothetical protein